MENTPEPQFHLLEKLVEFWNELEPKERIGWLLIVIGFAFIWIAAFLFWIGLVFFGGACIATTVVAFIISMCLLCD